MTHVTKLFDEDLRGNKQTGKPHTHTHYIHTQIHTHTHTHTHTLARMYARAHTHQLLDAITVIGRIMLQV